MERRGASDEAPCRRDGRSRSRMSIMNRWKVAVAAVVMQLGLGSLYAWSVFRQPLSAHYGASVTSVNVAFFVAIFVFGISTLSAGFLLRQVGPRFVGVAGGVLFGTGVFLSAFVEGSLSFLYFTYGIVAAVGGGFGVHSSRRSASQVVPGQTRPRLRSSGGWLRHRAGYRRPPHLDDRWAVQHLRHPGNLLRRSDRCSRLVCQEPPQGSRVPGFRETRSSR